jgi:hypothetical protein
MYLSIQGHRQLAISYVSISSPIDQNARKITFVEQLPDDILNHVIALIHGEIELGG